MMTNRFTIFALCTCLLAGCKSVDGTYYPGCIAYEGSKVSLNDGAVVWEKFTDQVVVDDKGDVVNQFPGYPKRGTYRIEGQVLQLIFDNGTSIETMHLHQHDGKNLLMTDPQFTAWQTTGHYEDCILTREVTAAN